MSIDETGLTIGDKISILRASWPEECALIGDHYLRVIASEGHELTQPQDGQNFQLKLLIDILTGALGVIDKVFTMLKNRRTKKKVDIYDVMRELDGMGVRSMDIQTERVRIIVERTHDIWLAKHSGSGSDEAD